MLWTSFLMEGANILDAKLNEVLYELVTNLLH